jgi:hypothetical protein
VKNRGRGNGSIDPSQLLIDWAGALTPAGAVGKKKTSTAPELVVLTLKWDFRTRFPEPREEAIEAGILQREDTTADGVRSIHEEHARELLAVLHDLSALLDARRRGVDPATGKAPRADSVRKRLAERFANEPGQLEGRKKALLGSYADAFGDEAADAFAKAVGAWHSGIEVVADVQPLPSMPASVQEPTKPRAKRSSRHVLPSPVPLPAAVKSGQFGYEEDGKPVRPCTAELRAIIGNHADKLIKLLDDIGCAPQTDKQTLRNQFAAGIAAFAEDFGELGAQRLRTFVEREAKTVPGCRIELP